jgi:hypothetical protein
MPKKLYVWLYAGTLAAGMLFLILSVAFYVINDSAGNDISPATSGLFLISALFGLLWTITHLVFYFFILARMWGAIQDSYTEISVGQAIGFLFIPFFNIYWMFKVWAGYPSEYNAYVARHQLDIPPLESGVFVTLPIILVLGAFYLPLLALPFVMIAVIIKGCDAVNAIENAPIGSTRSFFNPPPPPTRF